MIVLVTMAEEYLAGQRAWSLPAPDAAMSASPLRHQIAALRQDVSAAAGAPMLVHCCHTPRTLTFARRADIAGIAQGPATPDHAIRTKRLPMVGCDVGAYGNAYRAYFDAHAPGAKEKKAILDLAPRVVLDAELGMCTVGRTAKDAGIVRDLYEHTLDVIERSELLGGYRALPAQDIFDVEYWDLEQAKLRKSAKPPLFTGEAALVTGAASGIGKACVEALLARGAAVIGLDVDAAIGNLHRRDDFLGLRCDVTDEAAVQEALEAGVRAFGGLDMLVLNAGVFPGGALIADLGVDHWRSVMQVNLDANLVLMRECHPLLKLAPRKGRVIIIGSKNVPAPGPGAAAYSASKAGLSQLARVAALEWGADGIRVNILHPNQVFDTAIWSGDVLQARAAHYGMSVDEYKRNNVLRTQITSRDVAELAAEMCGPAFAKTTGAQVPIDGGNERVI
jgi:NAD(P)-dependent dehydrogenase (short-subunit alcohol dehydrogenase family)